MTQEVGSAIVAGAGGGIGAAVARRLAASGAHVVAIDVEFAESDPSVRQVVADLADAEACRAAVQEAGAGVDALVNTAAIRPTGSFEETDPETWQRCLDINLVGAARLMAAASPLLSDGVACILNLSSGAAWGKVGLSAYSASKAGLIGLTRTVATELSPRGIRANVLVPGTTETPMLASARASPTGTPDRSAPRNLGGEVLDPDDVAADVVACLDLRTVTGAVIPLGLLPKVW